METLQLIVARLTQNLTGIVVLSIVVVASLFYSKFFAMKVWKMLAEIENKTKRTLVTLPFGVLSTSVFDPATEELIFRLPLVLLFSSVTSLSWVFIVSVSVIFGVFHWNPSYRKLINAASEERGAFYQKSEEELKEIAKKGKDPLWAKMIGVVQSTSLGVLCGYFAVKTQNVLVAYAIHAIWNLVMPVVLMMIGLIVQLVVVSVSLSCQFKPKKRIV